MSGAGPLWATWMDAESDADPETPHEGTASERIAAARQALNAAKAREDLPALERLWAQIKALMAKGPHA